MRILVLSPFANIWNHASLEAVVADSLRASGHDITILRCDGLLGSFCLAMQESGLNALDYKSKSKKICNSCNRRAKVIDNSYNFKTSSIDEFWEIGDESWLNGNLNQLNKSNWHSFEIDSMPIGGYAAYEFLLTHKINSLEISDELWPAYVDQLKSSLVMHRVSHRVLAKYKPEKVIVLNRLYSVNRIFGHASDEMGIPCFSLSMGTQREKYGSSFAIYKNSQAEIEIAHSDSWGKHKSQALKFDQVIQVRNHLIEISKAKSPFTYSAKSTGLKNQDVHSIIGSDSGKKTILAITSSEDERFASDVAKVLPYSILKLDSEIFSSQAEWLEFLIENLQHSRDLQLVIRIHPRLFKNKRDGVDSESGIRFRELLTSLPENVHVNWPEQNVSLMEVAQITSVALNASSSAGIELLALGIPVVQHGSKRLFSYPPELNYAVESRDEYLVALHEALLAGRQLNNSIAAFRWLSFLFNRVARSVDDRLPDRSKWTMLRVFNGISLRTKLPVPSFLLTSLEKLEIRSGMRKLNASEDIDKFVQGNYQNLADLIEKEIEPTESEKDFEGKLILEAIEEILLVTKK